jgi:PAS domain S-box-containing protein
MKGSRSNWSATELRQQADRGLAQDASVADPVNETDIRQLVHELQAYQVDLGMQNEALRGAYSDLEAASQLYQELYDHAPVAYLNLSHDFRMLAVNRAGEALLGDVSKNLVGQAFASFVTPLQQDHWIAQARLSLGSGEPANAEYRLDQHGGGSVDVRMDFLVLSKAEADQELRIVLTDITEQVVSRREIQLHRSHLEDLVGVRNKSLVDAEKKYRCLFEGMMDAYVLMDMGGRILDSNPAFRAMLGYSALELQCLNRKDLTPNAWQGGDVGIVNELLASSGKSVAYEKQFMHKNGALIPVEVRAFLTRSDAGQPEAVWAVVREITMRERAASEARLHQAILENMGEGLHLVRTSDSVIVYANPALERMFGYAPAELLNRHVSCLNAAGALSPEEIADNINAALYRDGSWRGELQNVRKDGTPIWCLVNVSTFEHHSFGAVWLCVHTEISQRIALERALREEKRKFKLAVAGAELVVWDWNSDSDAVSMGEQWQLLFGYQPGDLVMIGSSLRTLIHPEDSERVRKAISRHLSGETQGFEVEYRLRHKRGHWVWVLDRGSVIERDLHGNPLRLAGSLIDVSRQKQLQTGSDDLLGRVEALVREVAQGNPGKSASRVIEADMKPAVRLSPRQREILRLVSAGMTSAQIADSLNISPATVMAHRRDIMRKLDLHTVAALTRYALENEVARS